MLHEFAHHLDGLSGAMGGTPMLTTRALRQNWQQITEAEFLSLVGSAQRGEATLLDHYGATNRAEFFAVATECFFERPHAMKRQACGVVSDTMRLLSPGPHAVDSTRRDARPSSMDRS